VTAECPNATEDLQRLSVGGDCLSLEMALSSPAKFPTDPVLGDSYRTPYRRSRGKPDSDAISSSLCPLKRMVRF
jgi:hypothetical protein